MRIVRIVVPRLVVTIMTIDATDCNDSSKSNEHRSSTCIATIITIMTTVITVITSNITSLPNWSQRPLRLIYGIQLFWSMSLNHPIAIMALQLLASFIGCWQIHASFWPTAREWCIPTRWLKFVAI